jgi:NADH:ubiquinone oxidoreductase subunit 3 (subunit A)
MVHKCLHEEGIKKLKDDMWGNGQKGVKMEMVVMKTQLKYLFIGLGFIITEITVLLIFVITGLLKSKGV